MRQPVDARAAAIMCVLCLLWGLQQSVIKAASSDISTMLQAGLRSGIAALLVWLFSKFIARDRWLEGVARGPGLVVGGLFAAEFLCIAEALRQTSASHTAIFLYTAPMFAALGLHLKLPEERLTLLQWAGIGLAFAGITLTFLGPGSEGAAPPGQLRGDLMALCAGAAWGLTTVIVRTSRLSEAPATQTLFYQLTGAALLLLPLAPLTHRAHFVSTQIGWLSLGFQGVVISFATYLVWFWMLRRYRAAQLGALSFMTPLFGVVMGAWLLREPLEPSFLAGAALVLLGLVVVNAAGWITKALRLSPSH